MSISGHVKDNLNYEEDSLNRLRESIVPELIKQISASNDRKFHIINSLIFVERNAVMLKVRENTYTSHFSGIQYLTTDKVNNDCSILQKTIIYSSRGVLGLDIDLNISLQAAFVNQREAASDTKSTKVALSKIDYPISFKNLVKYKIIDP